MKTRKTGRQHREGLVYGHLERVSRDLLKDHYSIVRRYIGRGSGIYALYNKERLTYVGLASALSGRIKAHLRDRHRESWDRFSIYLTVRDQHIKELESLLLRIAKPKSNVQSGRLSGSRDLKMKLQQAIRQQYQQEVAGLFAKTSRADKAMRNGNRDEKEKLLQLFPEGARGISKPFAKRYQLEEFGLGFMRLALETGTPIVPVSVIGAEEQAPAFADLKGLARLLGMPALPVVPVEPPVEPVLPTVPVVPPELEVEVGAVQRQEPRVWLWLSRSQVRPLQSALLVQGAAESQ